MSEVTRYLQPLVVAGQSAGHFHSLPALAEARGIRLARWPVSLRLLLESVLRNAQRADVGNEAVERLLRWTPKGNRAGDLPFVPARILAPDASGIPLFADLAAMRECALAAGISAQAVQPRLPVDFVIDHSLQVDASGTPGALKHNIREEFRRNAERYTFLKWAATAFDRVQLVPPGTGILHQVNMERLAQLVRRDDAGVFHPDSVVGPDSHTSMVNGLGLLAWGVGGIEAEAAMLGDPLSIPIPDVVGVELTGRLRAGLTATDLALHVTHHVRALRVVGSFVEFFGDGAATLSAEDRCTVANMAPEYGATVGYFPVDDETLRYFAATGRDADSIASARAWYESQGLFGMPASNAIDYSRHLRIALGEVMPCVAGPSRPQDLLPLQQVAASLPSAAPASAGGLRDDDIVLAAIASCANTSNPAGLITAGLVAKAAVARGLRVAGHIKTSFTPGSQVVPDYLREAGLLAPLEALGFHVAGFGCATCIGNSGPLLPDVERQLAGAPLRAVAVLSGNRNFEGRIHPRVKASYLMSPALVVAYALAGSMRVNLVDAPIAHDADGAPVRLHELWPDAAEVERLLPLARQPARFNAIYARAGDGAELWDALPTPTGATFEWDPASTYLRRPPFLDAETAPRGPIEGARALAILGDSVTTDHISPGGTIHAGSCAAQYLEAHGIASHDFNTYVGRRGNHEVMVRGTFASPRLKNAMVGSVEGGITTHQPSDERVAIFTAAERYRNEGVPLVVIAGAEYGTGSSRDWAAKGTMLLGVRAVIARSFERIHRSNLVGMGVLPCEFAAGEGADTLALCGDELYALEFPTAPIRERQPITLRIQRHDGRVDRTTVTARIDTPAEAAQFAAGGILHAALQRITLKKEQHQ